MGGPVTTAAWPPKRTERLVDRRSGPDLAALTGLRTGKPSYYPEYRVVAERLRRVIHALERISAALVRTVEGSEALVRAIAEAAAEHLTADWVVFALVDGELPDARPRHLVLGPDGVEWPADAGAVPARVLAHVRSVCAGRFDERDLAVGVRHRHIPVRLSGRVVGCFVAWTPEDREIDDTDTSVLHILAGQTAAALQNCMLLDRSERLYDQASRHAEDLALRNAELHRTQEELVAARQREVLDNERHRIARELHDSVTQYALSAGLHIDLCRSELDDDRLVAQLDTAKALTRRAVEQLRSAIYALNDDGCAEQDLPALLRRLSGVHMPDELHVEVRIGGTPIALGSECEQSLFRIAGEALFNVATHAEASRAVVRLSYLGEHVRLSVSDDGRGSPDEVRRSLRAASATPSGEHRGLVNMRERALELGGTLIFRRARLGGLQVQVDVPARRDEGSTVR